MIEKGACGVEACGGVEDDDGEAARGDDLLFADLAVFGALGCGDDDAGTGFAGGARFHAVDDAAEEFVGVFELGAADFAGGCGPGNFAVFLGGVK